MFVLTKKLNAKVVTLTSLLLVMCAAAAVVPASAQLFEELPLAGNDPSTNLRPRDHQSRTVPKSGSSSGWDDSSSGHGSSSGYERGYDQGYQRGYEQCYNQGYGGGYNQPTYKQPYNKGKGKSSKKGPGPPVYGPAPVIPPDGGPTGGLLERIEELESRLNILSGCYGVLLSVDSGVPTQCVVGEGVGTVSIGGDSIVIGNPQAGISVLTTPLTPPSSDPLDDAAVLINAVNSNVLIQSQSKTTIL